MRAHLRLLLRALAASAFFVVLGWLSSGLAYGANTSPTAAAAQMILRHNEDMERQYPKGSSVYAVDQYVILDGNNSLTVPADVTFDRDRAGDLRVIDIGSGYTWTFSSRATITRYNNNYEIIFAPGQSLDAVTQELIKLGGRRFELRGNEAAVQLMLI